MMRLKLKEQQNEEGFTLIELLVVVIIIGILAAIAIPVFLNQRQSAWQGSVESDVRNAAIEVETAATRAQGTYPADTTDADFPDDIQLSSDDVTVFYASPGLVDGDNEFELCGEHAELDGESVIYESGSGGLQDWDSGNDCAAVNAGFTDDV